MVEFKVINGGKSSGELPEVADVMAEAIVPHERAPIEELYERYGASVYSRCAYILKDRSKAEDAMQDVFAKALQNYKGFRAESSPLTWLTKIATYHCLNVLRAERAPWHGRFERDEQARVDRSEAHSGSSQALEARDLVRKVLARLDTETQAAAIHYHVDEMTLEEVARLLGRSVPTIRKRLQDVARAYRKELS